MAGISITIISDTRRNLLHRHQHNTKHTHTEIIQFSCLLSVKNKNDSPTGLRRELDVADFDEDVGVTAVGVKTDGDLAGGGWIYPMFGFLL